MVRLVEYRFTQFGRGVEEEDKSLMLLCSLLGNYDQLMMTLLYGKKILVYEKLVSVLQMNDQREYIVSTSMELPQDAMVAGERSWRGKKDARQWGGKISQRVSGR